jgi:hypothetical protein
VTEVLSAPPTKGRNIVIFSDGTGQRGGVYFDEARTNIYKLYRAARSGPDSNVPPDRQQAFYDPGLGTQPESGGSLLRAWRTFYNLVSQATGLGITHNIIDCYTAIIQLWRPGDRIFLFGFSRGAYTVRCLATALCYSGIPTRTAPGMPLKRDEASARRLATGGGEDRLSACQFAARPAVLRAAQGTSRAIQSATRLRGHPGYLSIFHRRIRHCRRSVQLRLAWNSYRALRDPPAGSLADARIFHS